MAMCWPCSVTSGAKKEIESGDLSTARQDLALAASVGI